MLVKKNISTDLSCTPETKMSKSTLVLFLSFSFYSYYYSKGIIFYQIFDKIQPERRKDKVFQYFRTT